MWVILPQKCGYTSWYGYLELLITRHILLSPLKFEVSRVDYTVYKVRMHIKAVSVTFQLKYSF